jgi:predicted phage terminase large subunit-like protein
MKLTSQLVHGFVGSLLAKRYDQVVATPAFHKELWEACCSDHPLVAIAAPRGHGKSTAVSHAYALASFLFRDRSFGVLVSDTETQAVNFLNDIKADLMDNSDLIELFQIKGFIKDSQTDIIVEFQDGVQFRIMVRGSEQRVRGLKWNQKRPDIIICDDMESDEQVQNKDRREKFRKWFNGALLPCRAKHGIVRVVGTVLHLDSLLNRLLPEDSAKSSIVEPLKTYSRLKNPTWKAIRYRAHNEDFSALLWPEMYSEEFFRSRKDDMTQQGIPEVYSQEYLNYPIDESTAFFKRDDFYEIPKFELDRIRDGEKRVNYYAAIDFAISTRERSDWSVIAIAAIDDRGMMNLVDLRRGRWDALEIIDEMFSVEKKYHPEIFAVERGTIEKALGPSLRAEMGVRNSYLKLKPLTPTKDKQSRARGIQARLRSGGIRFDKGASWYSDFEDEMVRFPKARHDDMVDAVSWLGLVVDEISWALTPEEEEENEYKELAAEETEGRSQSCGY